MVLPVEKLGSLVLRTICKPVANRLKKAAGKHPRFREHIIGIAQIYDNRAKSDLWSCACVATRPLNKEEAVQAAADLLGEIFVFSVSVHSFVKVAGAAIIFEVQRSARSEARKEELRKHELEAIKQKEENLERELGFTTGKLAELEHLAMAEGLSGIFNFRNPNCTTNAKAGSETRSNADDQSATHARKDPKLAPPAHSTKDTKQVVI
ncbi:hypothetical protein C5167_018685 [Papaver somniferum]|uniref:OPA3-like protein n=1 Tax=Papaver somniferum TaxID=3469 RepID=A0A4Y7IRY7_PAPSO|nr:hypothetical protein C5167_018685 [Papaver somniferum]